MNDLQKGSKKLLNVWAFYDWANSVYTLVIISAIFPIFYASLFSKSNPDVTVFGLTLTNTALITFITAFAFLVIAIMSPILSGIADYIGNKKMFLQTFCYIGSASCLGLYFFSLEHIYVGLFCYFFALIGYWGSIVFYNSYLPDVAFKEQQDGLSAKGYSMGYIGSVTLLLICLFLVIGKEGEEAVKAMRLSFILTGIWWAVFAQYTFFYLPKGNHNSQKVTKAVFFNGFKELLKVKNQLFENASLKSYLIAFFVYSMAVQTVILIATYFGEKEIAWENDSQKTMGLIVSILVINLVAILGAILTSKASNKFGNIPTLIVINAIWVVICICAYFVTLPIHFYITAGFVGLVMGGIQALSRSTYSKFLPETDDTTSFFSFYDVTEKVGIVIGMSIYGIIDQLTDSMRNSILFLGMFFVIGLVLLFRVPKKSF